MFARTPIAAALVAVGLFTTIPLAEAGTIRWNEIANEDGIKVWQRKIPGQSLVEFRGRGIVNNSFLKILAVLHDTKRKTEWMDSCVGSHKVRTIGPGKVVMYNRTGSTVPLINDRDVVMESNVDIWPDKRRITIDVWNVKDPKAPEIDGVVRMPELRASWVLNALAPDRTEITYTVRADPGGALPHWLVNMVAKRLPSRTLLKLRKQVVKSGYEGELALVKSSFDWSGFNFDEPAPPAAMKPLEPGASAANP